MVGLSAAQAARLARSPVAVLSANRFTSQLVRSLFFGLGMQDVVVASDQAAAIERFQLSHLDLVVADTGQATFAPGKALAVLRKLEDERQAGIPVILLAAPGMEPGLARLDNVLLLNKPLSHAPLKKAVFKLLLNIEEQPLQAQAAMPTGRRITALLLSGNPYTAQVVRTLLLTLGLSDLAVAGTAADADHKLGQSGFDLVIADTGPASFDGLAILEAIRGRTALAGKPVLLLASNPSAGLVQRARAVEVKAIATKPLDPDAFADRVRKILAAAPAERVERQALVR